MNTLNQAIEIVYKGSSQFVSYSVKTSRLGYFSRIPPSYGMFIIYDVQSDEVYYDFTEKIISRIDEQRDDDWRNQETVKINIPTQNILSENNVKSIYDILMLRFKNHTHLIREKGAEYFIPPTLDKTNAYQNNDIFEKFEKIGYLLFNEREFNSMYNYFEKIPQNKISSSKMQTLLAFVTYCELGRAIEANFFLSKSKRFNDDFDDFEKDIREIYILKLEFLLGEITTQKYAERLEQLETLTKDDLNKISICTNIIQLKLIGIFEGDRINNLKIEDELFHLLKEVNEYKNIDETTKHYLKINIAEGIFIYTVNLFLEIGKIIQIQRDVNIEPNYRREDTLKTVPFFSLVNNILISAHKFSIDIKDELLQAESAYKLGWIFVTMQFNTMILKQLTTDKIVLPLYEAAHNYFAEALRIYQKNGRFTEYRKALLGLYDLKTIYSFLKSESLGDISTSEIMKEMRRIEKEHDLPPIYSTTEEMINETYKNNSPKLLKDYSENDINTLLELLMKAYKYPENCREHLLVSIRSRRLFNIHNTDDRFVLLEKQVNLNLPYTEPVSFMIQNKNTGFATLGNPSVEYLMKQVRMIE